MDGETRGVGQWEARRGRGLRGRVLLDCFKYHDGGV